MNRRSIRFRLTAWYAAILAVTFAAVAIGVWLTIRDSINDTVDKDLRSRLQTMRDFLERQTSDTEAPLEELIENAAIAPSGTQFRAAGGNGRWLYQSPAPRFGVPRRPIFPTCRSAAGLKPWCRTANLSASYRLRSRQV